MAFLIVFPSGKAVSWEKRIRAMAPDADVRVWPDVGDPGDIEFVLTWNHPPGAFKHYRHLKCIASMGAGVDHILRDPERPLGIPITRIMDPSMAQSMSEYIVMSVLNHCHHTNRYRENQSHGLWAPKIPRQAGKTCVGIMGLGQLGSVAAERLNLMGFNVIGWRRSPQVLAGIETLSGDDRLDAFLDRVTILICMLPLTDRTRGILNRDTFGKLKTGAYLINVARGEHLIETDMLDALETGQLSGACLDVFKTEPLPEGHPYWTHPGIVVTPHISSLTNPAAVVPQIVENYRRVRSGSPPMNTVDVGKGY